MNLDTTSFLTMTVALFAITGSIAIIPIFISATDGQTAAQRRETALIAASTYVVAALIALFVGNAALKFFGISVAALRVAGMSVVAVIGWNMLNAATPIPTDGDTHHLHTASNTKIPKARASSEPNKVPSPLVVGVMPLGFPIYGGPGVLSVIIAWGSGSSPVYLAALTAIFANALVIISLDFLAAPITRLIGASGLLITEKVFGLIAVAIAVTSIASALLVLFPGLNGVVVK
jgi:multiple antibiotic resistance protein